MLLESTVSFHPYIQLPYFSDHFNRNPEFCLTPRGQSIDVSCNFHAGSILWLRIFWTVCSPAEPPVRPGSKPAWPIQWTFGQGNRTEAGSHPRYKWYYKSCRKMKRVRMLRRLKGLAELIWYKKTCEVHYMQRYIFKRSGLDSVGGGCPTFYLEMTGSTALIRKAGVGIPQV